MYQLILFIHVTTAIIGFGHTFLFPYILHMPKAGHEVKTIAKILSHLGKVAKISDFLLLFTGLFMIVHSEMGFSVGWINLSLILFILMRISSSVVSKKTSHELYALMENIEGEHLPEEFEKKRSAYMPKLWLTQSINFLIIMVMVFKPRIEILSF